MLLPPKPLPLEILELEYFFIISSCVFFIKVTQYYRACNCILKSYFLWLELCSEVEFKYILIIWHFFRVTLEYLLQLALNRVGPYLVSFMKVHLQCKELLSHLSLILLDLVSKSPCQWLSNFRGHRNTPTEFVKSANVDLVGVRHTSDL